MSWRGEDGAIQAVNQNHYAIMTPNGNMYLDYYQGVPESEPVAIGGFLPLSRVYEYDPIPAAIPEQKSHFILGLQGNLWTEYIATPEHAEYMLFPRAAAIAEIGWSSKEQKEYQDFSNRLATHFARLEYLDVHYSKSQYAIKAVTEWSKNANQPQIKLTTECKECEVRYTINGSNPDLKSDLYIEPIIIKKSVEVRAQAFKNGVPFSPIYIERLLLHKGTGKPYEMSKVNPA